MRLVLDACALFPRLMRGALLGYAEAGGFAPLWSARIIGEWERAAAAKLGPAAAAEARAVAARMRARFPDAETPESDAAALTERLPDPDDAHVIAAAAAAGADGIVTLNTRDFPLRALGARRLARLHPDAFLRAEWAPGGPLDRVLADMAAADPDLDLARGLKTAGLPRLAKAWRAARA